MNIKKHIGSRVREARNRVGLTQEGLAEKAVKTPETISNLERGTVLTSITTLEQISTSLGVPLAYFFEGVERSKKAATTRVRAESYFTAALTQLSDDQLALAAEFVNSLADYSVSRKRSK